MTIFGCILDTGQSLEALGETGGRKGWTGVLIYNSDDIQFKYICYDTFRYMCIHIGNGMYPLNFI